MALTEIPKELSSTPSIVDGGNATAITINADESVALANKLLLGTDSGDAFNSNAMIKVQSSGSGFVQIKTSTTGQGGILFGDTDDDFAGGMIYNNNTDVLSFHANNAERLSISSAGVATVANGLTLTNGNVVVANGHGIDFSATGNISGTSSELLDDYEEGTWTPTVAGCSISVARASYTKIGNLVTVNFNFSVTATDGSTGPVSIAGRPFVGSSANAESNGSLMIQYVTTIANTINLSLYTYSRHGTMEIYQTRSNNGVWVKLNRSQINANSTAFIGSMTYETDT